MRLQDWHRRAMRANAAHDPEWLDDLAVAEASGFVHEHATERVVSERPDAVDACRRRVQVVIPAPPR